MCVGLPGRILRLEGDDLERRATVDFGSVVQSVSVATLPDAATGDWIIVHSGFAVRRLSQAEAVEATEHFAEAHRIAGS